MSENYNKAEVYLRELIGSLNYDMLRNMDVIRINTLNSLDTYLVFRDTSISHPAWTKTYCVTETAHITGFGTDYVWRSIARWGETIPISE